MPWLLSPVFYGTDEEKAQAIADAEAKGYRLFRDERNVGTDVERPHKLTFEGGWQRKAPATSAEDGDASGLPASRMDELTAKLRDSSASLQEVIEYLRLRDEL